MEFATVYFSQREVFYEITKQQSGAISTITADVRTKCKFQTHLGHTRFGTTPYNTKLHIISQVTTSLLSLLQIVVDMDLNIGE